MKILIVPDDYLVVIDGSMIKMDLTSLIDADVHMVKWHGTTGFVRYIDKAKPVNINTIDPFQPVIDAFNVLKAERELQQQQEMDNRHYKIKRMSEYPSLVDQLEALWKWAEGEGLIADINADLDTAPRVLAEIKVIQTKYPKV